MGGTYYHINDSNIPHLVTVDVGAVWDQAGLLGDTIHSIILARMGLDSAVSNLQKILRD